MSCACANGQFSPVGGAREEQLPVAEGSSLKSACQLASQPPPVVSHYAVRAFLWLAALLAFLPLSPDFPDDSLDSSWKFGLNEAVARHLVFGRDILFTFGPYASVETTQYHPGTAGLMFLGCILLGVCYAQVLVLVAVRTPSRWLLLYGAFLICFPPSSGLSYYRNALLLSYPLLLSILVYHLTLREQAAGSSKTRRWAGALGLGLLFAPLGLLPFVKLTLLPISGVVALASLVVFARTRQYRLACAAILSPVLSTILFWYLSEQPLRALPGFFWNTLPIVSGYSEGMAIQPMSPWTTLFLITLYLSGALFLMIVVLVCLRAPIHSRLYLAAGLAILLFIAFKNGFVRAFWVQLAIPVTALCFACLLVVLVHRRRALIRVLIAAFGLFLFCTVHDNWGSAVGIIHARLLGKDASPSLRFRPEQKKLSYLARHVPVSDGFRIAARLVLPPFEHAARRVEGFAAFVFQPRKRRQALQEEFAASLQAIRLANPIPRLKGDVDIYPFDLSILIASGNTWNPRPVFQSYQAYAQQLADRNAAHLQTTNSPKNVLFRVRAIDGRLPSLEDGASWPILLTRYSVAGVNLGSASNSLILLRPRNAEAALPEYKVLSAGAWRLGDSLKVPPSDLPIYAEITFTPTVLGRLWRVLFRAPAIWIKPGLRDGSNRTLRLIPGMASSRFLLSPLIESTEDFVILAGPDFGRLRDKDVENITLEVGRGGALCWGKSCRLRLTTPRHRAS